MKKNITISILIVLSLFSFAIKPAFSSQSRNLTIFTESNMALAITKILHIYSQKNNVIVSVNFGSSEDVITGIDSGEPSDVLISAHRDLIDNLRQKGLIDVYNIGYVAKDQLSLITLKNNPQQLEEKSTIEDYLQILNQNKSTLVIDYEGTSSGKISQDFLNNFPIENITLVKKVAEDKSEIIKSLEADNSLYALVLKSQIRANDNVKILATKSDKNIFYQALVIAGDNMEAAREFLRFLKSDTAKKILIESGFSVE